MGDFHFSYIGFFLPALSHFQIISYIVGCFPYPCMTSRDVLLRLRRGDRLDCSENCFEEL